MQDEWVAALRAAVRVGDEQLDRDKGIPYTPELLDRAMARALVNARRGKKISFEITGEA